MDHHDKKTRSYNMSRVRSKDTKPELLVRKYLFGRGFRYRLQDKRLPGKPDLVLKKYRTVIFVNGCFWHGHAGCPKAKLPDTRRDWWAEKIQTNTDRDRRNIAELEAAGWHVITVWQCELTAKRREQTLAAIAEELIDRLVALDENPYTD